MYDSILLAVDVSEQSDRATLAARDLAELSGGTVHLFHVRERQYVVGKSGGSFDVEESEEADALISKQREVLEAAGIKVDANVSHAPLGTAANEIVAAAKAADVDLIIMGSHGRSSLAALVIGSNAYKVLHLADRPVLVVR